MNKYEEDPLNDNKLLQSIKEQKEHAERGVNQLLEHFSEKGSYLDSLR